MMKWLTALFFSLIVHILIFFSYVLFTTESIENKTRKITNVSFLDKKLQNKEEENKSSKLQEKKQKKIHYQYFHHYSLQILKRLFGLT